MNHYRCSGQQNKQISSNCLILNADRLYWYDVRNFPDLGTNCSQNCSQKLDFQTDLKTKILEQLPDSESPLAGPDCSLGNISFLQGEVF